MAYTNTQTAGNANILAIGWNDVTANLTSVTDSAGNTYHQGVAKLTGNDAPRDVHGLAWHKSR